MMSGQVFASPRKAMGDRCCQANSIRYEQSAAQGTVRAVNLSFSGHLHQP